MTQACRSLGTGLYDNYFRLHNYLRISVTDKCNFRCNYCYPQQINHKYFEHQLSLTEITKIVDLLYKNASITKIRITGGEPLLKSDTIKLINHIKINTDIATIGLTTNGYFLMERLNSLVNSGLTNLNVSLDTLDPIKFSKITGCKRKSSQRFEKVFTGLTQCLRNKLFPVIKINCVIMRNFNEDEIFKFVDLACNQDVEVRFIEYMPFLDNGWDTSKLVPYGAILGKIKSRYPNIERINAIKGSSARVYQIPGFVGRIGFISTMTQHFCGSCNRIRLTSNGLLKHCIFGHNAFDFKPYLRGSFSQNLNDQEWNAVVMENIRSYMTTKKAHHTENEKLSKSLPMIQLGG